MNPLNLPAYPFKIVRKETGSLIFDHFRKTYVALTPEEWVRQHFLMWLVTSFSYPAGLIAVETSLKYNRLQKRADAVVYDKKGVPVALIECKAPSIAITQSTLEQAARYNYAFKTRFLLLTNGVDHFCCKIDLANQKLQFLEKIPTYEELSN